MPQSNRRCQCMSALPTHKVRMSCIYVCQICLLYQPLVANYRTYASSPHSSSREHCTEPLPPKCTKHHDLTKGCQNRPCLSRHKQGPVPPALNPLKQKRMVTPKVIRSSTYYLLPINPTATPPPPYKPAHTSCDALVGVGTHEHRRHHDG